MAPKPNLIWITYSIQAQEDLAHWLKEDPKKLAKIEILIESTMLDPTQGIGVPKPLKYSLEGAWSRRISHEHRLVYTFTSNTLNILQARGHY